MTDYLDVVTGEDLPYPRGTAQSLIALALAADATDAIQWNDSSGNSVLNVDTTTAQKVLTIGESAVDLDIVLEGTGQVRISPNNILVNDGGSVSNYDGGLFVQRAAAAFAGLFWDESADEFAAAQTITTPLQQQNVLIDSYLDLHVNDLTVDGTITGGGGVTDHGALTGLSDDDHAQHALLAGRSGGQTLVGGIDAGDDLILESTAHGTKGFIQLGGAVASTTNLGLLADATSKVVTVNFNAGYEASAVQAVLTMGGATNNFIIDNTAATGDIIMQLGADSSLTKFVVAANADGDRLTVDGDGRMELFQDPNSGALRPFNIISRAGETGDVGIRLNLQANPSYSIAIDDSDDDQLKMSFNATKNGAVPGANDFFQYSGASQSMRLGESGGTIGVLGAAGSAVVNYTRTAGAEARTLLASGSATTVNNNNVLAALIEDLTSFGYLN